MVREPPIVVTNKIPTNIAKAGPQTVTSKIFGNINRDTPQVVTNKVFATAKDTQPQTVTEKVLLKKVAPIVPNNIPPLQPSKNVPQTVTNKIFAPVPRESPQQQSVAPKIIATDLPRPQTATSKIFAPRTEDMNKGFLMFSDEEPGLTMLKDEPEDLTHLAPTAGDVCVPLETSVFMTDMFEDIMFSENYCSILGEDFSCVSDSQSSNASKGSGDPFFSYREELSPSSSPSDLNSPALTKSPGDCSIPSLCSPGFSSEEDHMTQLMSVEMDSPCTDVDDDMTMRAPYIPMGVGEDLPLLISEELLWGPLQDKPTSEDNWPLLSSTSKPDLSSNLAQLLCSDTTVPSSLSPPLSTGRGAITHSTDRGGGLISTNGLLRGVYCKKEGPAADCEWPVSPSLRQQRGPPDPVRDPGGVTMKRAPDRPPCKRTAGVGGAGGKRARHTPTTWAPPDGGGTLQKPPLPPPGESVLMNLLVSGCDDSIDKKINRMKFEPDACDPPPEPPNGCQHHKEAIRKNSFSLLEPGSTTIPSLADLSQQDYDVNAPISSNGSLLQGQDLLSALEVSSSLM